MTAKANPWATGVQKMPETNKPGDRWALLEKTSPSGKAMFRCLSCGSEGIAPQKICWVQCSPYSLNNQLVDKEPNLACLTWQQYQLHYYRLGSVKGDGWANIVISSTGYFSAVSAFGNYAFFWPAHGYDDFRQFLVNAHHSWDYFASKLSYGPGGKHKEYDGHATYQMIKEHILAERRQSISQLSDGRRFMPSGAWTAEKARAEWDLLHEECEKVSSPGDWDHWMRETSIQDAYEYHCERWPGGLERFCKETLARLSDVLLKDLERDGISTQGLRL